MEPVSLTATALATLVITKAAEKTGEKIGEKALEQGGKLVRLLKERFPAIATSIELAEQQPLDAGQAVLIQQQVEDAANADPEIAQAVQAVAGAVQSQATSIYNFTKLAEKIGMVVQGGTVNNPSFNF